MCRLAAILKKKSSILCLTIFVPDNYSIPSSTYLPRVELVGGCIVTKNKDFGAEIKTYFTLLFIF